MVSVADLLSKQNEQLNVLLSLLDRELHLISVREPDQLLKVVEEKTLTLDGIQETDTQIESALAARENKSLTEDEQRLMDRVTHTLAMCKHATSINQKAVEQGQLKLAHLRQLLVDVRSRESLTYDKSGKPKGGLLGKGISA